jgi:hypothetical protein
MKEKKRMSMISQKVDTPHNISPTEKTEHKTNPETYAADTNSAYLTSETTISLEPPQCVMPKLYSEDPASLYQPESFDARIQNSRDLSSLFQSLMKADKTDIVSPSAWLREHGLDDAKREKLMIIAAMIEPFWRKAPPQDPGRTLFAKALVQAVRQEIITDTHTLLEAMIEKGFVENAKPGFFTGQILRQSRKITIADLGCHILSLVVIDDYEQKLNRRYTPVEQKRLPPALHRLTVIREHLLAGRILSSFGVQRAGAMAIYNTVTNQMNYGENLQNDLFIKPTSTAYLTEATILHEMFHALQDDLNRHLPKHLYEAQAYTAQAFYRLMRLGKTTTFYLNNTSKMYKIADARQDIFRFLKNSFGLDLTHAIPPNEITYYPAALKEAIRIDEQVRAGKHLSGMEIEETARLYANNLGMNSTLHYISKQNLTTPIEAMIIVGIEGRSSEWTATKLEVIPGVKDPVIKEVTLHLPEEYERFEKIALDSLRTLLAIEKRISGGKRTQTYPSGITSRLTSSLRNQFFTACAMKYQWFIKSEKGSKAELEKLFVEEFFPLLTQYHKNYLSDMGSGIP